MTADSDESNSDSGSRYDDKDYVYSSQSSDDTSITDQEPSKKKKAYVSESDDTDESFVIPYRANMLLKEIEGKGGKERFI